MDATTTQAVQDAGGVTTTQTAADNAQSQAAAPVTTMVGASDAPGANLADTAAAETAAPLTDTEKDIQNIKQAIASLEQFGAALVGDEIAALNEKLAALEEKARQEAAALLKEVEEEVYSLADLFYAKTGIRPWGLVIVVGLYLAVKVAGTFLPWLK